jgi:hypothetical protein
MQVNSAKNVSAIPFLVDRIAINISNILGGNMKNNILKSSLIVGSIIATITLTGCSPAGSGAKSSLTDIQCGVIGEVQPRIMNLMGKFGSVLSEDIDTRQRAVWDSGYENIQAYTDELSQEAQTLRTIAEMDNVSEEDATIINDLVDGIYNFNSHWADEDGTELMNSQTQVNEGEYNILDLCM